MDFEQKEYLYSEIECIGNRYRIAQLKEYSELIDNMRWKADIHRKAYFKPDMSSVEKYKNSIVKYRHEFFKMLGWPLSDSLSGLEAVEPLVEYVAEDSLGKIYRLSIEAIEGLTAYGLLFIPYTPSPHALIIALHGGQGTPELCSGFYGPSNYNDMTRRVLKKGFAVFAPQLQLWGEKYGPDRKRAKIDIQLKQLGSSITAVEIFKIMRSLDYLTARQDIDSKRIGMLGLSYGGFYTLFTSAADERIKAAVSSCFFNNRYMYDREDRIWFNSANLFLDPEVCALICPRPLYIEVGKKDEIFDVKYVDEEFQKVRTVYKMLGVDDRLGFKKFDGAHELDVEDDGIEFLCKWLNT